MAPPVLDEDIRQADVLALGHELEQQLVGDRLRLNYAKALLNEISKEAAIDMVSLKRQTNTYKRGLLQGIILEAEQLTSTTLPSLTATNNRAKGIYAPLNEADKLESIELRALFQRHGGDFDSLALHESSFHSEMTGLQVASLMPGSDVEKGLEVFAPLQSNVPETFHALSVPLADAMKKPSVKAILIPVGPGHWRQVAITKAQNPTDKHQVEIFDSFGEGSAKGIEGAVKALLLQSGQDLDNYNITFKGAKHRQSDGYSCGDYAVAHAHEVAQKMDAAYDEKVVRTLNQEGNHNGALRKTMRQKSQEATHGALLAPSRRVSAPTTAAPNVAEPKKKKVRFEKPVVKSKPGTRIADRQTPTRKKTFVPRKSAIKHTDPKKKEGSYQTALTTLLETKGHESSDLSKDVAGSKLKALYEKHADAKTPEKETKIALQENIDEKLARKLEAGQFEGMTESDEKVQIEEALKEAIDEALSSSYTPRK